METWKEAIFRTSRLNAHKQGVFLFPLIKKVNITKVMIRFLKNNRSAITMTTKQYGTTIWRYIIKRSI